MQTHQYGQLLLVLILFTVISFGTMGGAIVYQGIAQLIGFNTADSVVSSCSSFINYKLTIASTLYKIAFIGGIFSCLCLICALIVLIVQKCGIKKKKPTEQLLNQQLQPNNNAQTSIMSQNRLILMYIIYSLAILGNIMHFGLMLNVFICQMQCKMTVNVPQIVIFGLSFLCLLILMMAWISIQVLRYKINQSLEILQQKIQQQLPNLQHQNINQTQIGDQGIVTTNKNGNKYGKMDVVNEANKNMQQNLNSQQKQNNRTDERYYVTNNINSSHPLNATKQLNEPLLLKNTQIEMVPIQVHPINTNNVSNLNTNNINTNNIKKVNNGSTNIKQDSTLPTKREYVTFTANVPNVDKSNIDKANIDKADADKANVDKVNVNKPVIELKKQQIIKPMKDNQIMMQNKVKTTTQNNVNMISKNPINDNNIQNTNPQTTINNKQQNNEKLIPKISYNTNMSAIDDQNINKNKTSTSFPLNNEQFNNKVAANKKVTEVGTTKIAQQQEHIQPIQTKQNSNLNNPIMTYSVPITNSNPDNARISNNILDQPPQPIQFILSEPQKIPSIKPNTNVPPPQLTYSVAPKGEKQNIAYIPVLVEPSAKKLQIVIQNNEEKDQAIIKNTKQIKQPIIQKEIKVQNNNNLIKIQQSNINEKKKKKKRSPKSKANSQKKPTENQLKNQLLLQQQVQLQQQQQQFQMQIQQQQQMLIMQLQQQLHQSQIKSQAQNHPPNPYTYAHQQEYYPPKYEGRRKSVSPPPIPKKSPIKYTQQMDQSSIQFDNYSQYKIIQSPHHKKQRQLQHIQWPQTSKGNTRNRYEKQRLAQNEQNEKILNHSIAMSKISRQNQSRQDENYVNKQKKSKDQLSRNKYFKSVKVSQIQQKSKEVMKNLMASQGFQSNQSSNKKKTDSDQNFQEEERKFYQSVSSRTQRQYVQQRDPRDTSQLNLHKDLKKQIQHRKQDSTQRVYSSKLIKSNKPKKKVSLIDYIRSKYAE